MIYKCDICGKEGITQPLNEMCSSHNLNKLCDNCSNKANKKLRKLRGMYIDRAWKETKYYLQDLKRKYK